MLDLKGRVRLCSWRKYNTNGEQREEVVSVGTEVTSEPPDHMLTGSLTIPCPFQGLISLFSCGWFIIIWPHLFYLVLQWVRQALPCPLTPGYVCSYITDNQLLFHVISSVIHCEALFWFVLCFVLFSCPVKSDRLINLCLLCKWWDLWVQGPCTLCPALLLPVHCVCSTQNQWEDEGRDTCCLNTAGVLSHLYILSMSVFSNRLQTLERPYLYLN